MKHFALIKAPRYRKESYLLLSEDGEEFAPFSKTMSNMRRQNYSIHSIEQYAGHIGRFIDFIYEAGEQAEFVTPEYILEVVYSYESYLLFGSKSENTISLNIALELNPKKSTQRTSLIPISAAIKYFLTLSDAEAASNKQSTLFTDLSSNEIKKLSLSEKQKLKKNSMLAGVLCNGANYTKRSNSLFSSIPSNASSKFKRVAIPFDKTIEIINAAKSYRDKAFYSLLAASGGRQHEVLQIQQCDIDIEERSVVLIDPAQRESPGLTQTEFEKECWKGRSTEVTFLIEPFKSLFFEYLEKYIKHERIAHSEHDYIFQKKGGRPYFTASRQSRSEAFRKLKSQVGLEDRPDISTHSIRHMYGTYTLNYLPLENGFGFPMPIVKILMGHASINSTENYAKQDEDLILAKIEYANRQVFGLEEAYSLDEIRLRYHQEAIDKLLTTINAKTLRSEENNND